MAPGPCGSGANVSFARKVVGVKLADELLLVSLSPSEPRNTRVHGGIRYAVCGADVLESWFEGGPLPGDLRRHIRKHSHQSLEPVLMRLAAAGQIATRSGRGLLGMLGARSETLTDVPAGAAIRSRLQAALADPGVPPARDAALAVLIIQAKLWNWAELETMKYYSHFRRPRPEDNPLWEHGAALAVGSQVLAQDTAGVLHAMARAIVREYDFED
jgi:hypothetical protein